MRLLVLCGIAALLVGCSDDNSVTIDDLHLMPLTLPNGKVIQVEALVNPEDQLRGMEFRSELKPDRGMLYIHHQIAKTPHRMYQVLIPLDIVWLDSDHRIIEMAANAQPCKTAASKCPVYGGQKESAFSLQLPAGSIGKYGLEIGQVLRF